MLRRVHIIGGWLIGLNCLDLLSRISSSICNGEIRVYEKDGSILSAWNSKIINEHRVNNGFHGIEPPRCESLIPILKKTGLIENMKEVANHRMLYIDKHLISFKASIDEWPESLKEGLAEIIKRGQETHKDRNILKEAILNESFLGEVVARVYKRFSEEIDECWNLIFPWFFPTEFCFDDNDEGGVFQNQVRGGTLKPKYLLPRTNIFEDLKTTAQSYVLNSGAKIIDSGPITGDNIRLFCENPGDMTIWCASSFGLLQYLNPSLAKSCISSIRHLHLLLFSLSRSSRRLCEDLFR